MPAFTQLCEKVNISLFDDTVTLYPKKTGGKSWQPVLIHPIFGVLVDELDCLVEEAIPVVAEIKALKESVRFVRREDACHDRYHQDSFDLDDTHYHMKFSKTIDEPKLKQILAIFTKHNLISDVEQAKFIENYRIVKQSNAQLDQLASGSNALLDDSDDETLPDSTGNLPFARSFGQPLAGSEIEPVLAIKALSSHDLKQQAFIDQLQIMNEKAMELAGKALSNPDYEEANKKARALCDSLYLAYLAFRENPSNVCFCNTFDEACKTAFQTAEETLKEHREWGGEWGEVLANIALAVALLVVGYVAYGFYNKYHNNDRFMFFKTNTDSGNKMDNLKTAAHEMVNDTSFCVY